LAPVICYKTVVKFYCKWHSTDICNVI